jgi:hypothetical protein
MNPSFNVAAAPQVTSASVPGASWNRVAWGAILVAAAGISAAFVYFKIFSIFQSYDDEGYILLSLKSFAAGKPLYDEVYSSFQPAFYVMYRLFFVLSGVSVCHDNIRFVTLVLWMLAAALNGLITRRLTGSGVLSLVVVVISVRLLEPFANEPGHPQTIACVLVQVIVACCTFTEAFARRRLAIGLGVLVGLTVLTKINIGVFVALPLAILATAGNAGKLMELVKFLMRLLMLSFPSLLWHAKLRSQGMPIWALIAMDGLSILLVAGFTQKDRSPMRRATFAMFAAVFILLQMTELSVAALPVYSAGLLTLSISTALLMCADRREWAPAGLVSWQWGVVGFVAAIAGVVLIVLLGGTTLHGLFTGLFVWPARVAAGFLIRPRSNALGPLLGLAGALACYCYVTWRGRLGETKWFRISISCGQVSFGLLVLAEYYFRRPGSSTLMPLHSDLPHFWMLPFAWLIVASAKGTSSMLFGRLALLLIAVMQPLIACPVAGTQLVPGSILLVVVAAVCVGDGLSALVQPIVRSSASAWPKQSLEIICAVLLLAPFARETLQLRESYAALTPLELPGAAHIRLTPEEVRVYHQIVAELAKPEVKSFLTLPGMDSLYLWAQKPPPNELNVSAWIVLLDDSEQERIWRAAQKFSGLKVVRNRQLIRRWVGGRSVSQLALVRHIDEEFAPEAAYGGYEILALHQPRIK